jgi:signal transduction histidine kinase
MKIGTRLKLNTFISLGVIILILLSLVWSFREVSRATRNIDLANEMQKVTVDRIALRDEYLLYREERARIQWLAKSETLRGLIEAAAGNFDSSGDRALVMEVRKYFDATFTSFSQFMEARKREERSATKGVDFTEAESRLIGQVFLKAYSLSDSIGRLHESAHSTMRAAQIRHVLAVVLFIISSVIAIIMNSVSISKILENRITALSKGVKIIGDGDFDYRISTEGEDELTALARQSNEMAARLKQSYTSLANLQAEVELRKRAEANIEKYIKDLKRSNEELQQFAYVASHDLQEPLRMVASYTQLLAARYEGQLDDKAHKYIEYAVDGAVRMQRLINDLLDFSRVGTRGMPMETTDCNAVLEEAINNLAAVIDESGAILTKEELPTLQADASQLILVFQNLISNAIKFRGEAFPTVHVSAQDQGPEWVFSLKDNGIGIDPQYADKIFLIFQRLHTRQEYPGTGIGLAVCKRIVERHGGRIWVESAPGTGSTFFFTIPNN